MNQQQEIRHQEAVIAKLKSFNREKSIRRAESREKMLDKIDVLEKPTETRADMHLHLEPQILSGNDVLTVEHLSKSFPGNPLFSDLNFQIQRGEKVAVIGDNGTGKTTILKIINGLEQADHGSCDTRQQGAHQLLRSGAPAAAYGKDTAGGNFGRLSGDDRHRRFAMCSQPFSLPEMMYTSAFRI